MDGIVILIVALLLVLKTGEVVNEEVIMKRETKLNPDYYEDENAFMEVAHELGFH